MTEGRNSGVNEIPSRFRFEDKRDARSILSQPKDGYVIIVTYGRSGSTLLQNVLNSIDGYCIRGENGGMTGYLARAALLPYTHRDYVQRRTALAFPDAPGLDHVRTALGRPGDPWYGIERVDPDRLGRRLLEVFVEEIVQPGSDVRVAGFKEIRFHQDPNLFADHLDILRAMLPGTRFIFLTRDHEAVMRSGWHVRMNRFWLRRNLRMADRLFAEYAQAHPKCSLRLRYETLKEQPQNFAPLFAFLGEPFDAVRVQGVLDERLTHLTHPKLTWIQRIRLAGMRTVGIVPGLVGRIANRNKTFDKVLPSPAPVGAEPPGLAGNRRQRASPADFPG